MAGVARDALLEREGELRRLGDLLDGALEGRGGVALVEGPAGIGKTRLLEAGCAGAAERGIRVLSARGSDLERQFAYGVVRQLFEPVLTGSVPRARAALLAGLAAYAEPVFRSTALAAESDVAPDRSAAVLHGLHWLTRNLAELGPLVIAVDDGHWGDLSSLLFLQYVARRLEGLPVALVVTSRRGEPGVEAELVRRMAIDTPGSVLELGPLSVEATARFVRSLVGVDAVDELCRACHAATGGNPFLVHELATALVRDGRSPGVDAAARVGRLVPDAVARHVLVRISGLGSTAIRIAHAVAVLGAEAELRHVVVLAGLGEAETADAVDALVSADILSPAIPLEFTHPLLREAVYQDMRPAERMLSHAHAARLLADAGSSPERVALQLLACEPDGSEWAIVTLRAAAREATARGAPGSVARYLERALAQPLAPTVRRELLLELGVAESRAAQPRAADHLSAALRLTPEPVARARIAQELAGLYNLQGRYVDSAAILEHAIDALGEAEQELRFSLEAELAVVASMDDDVRRRLAPRMAALRAKVQELWALPAAAPLLAVIAFELAQTDGTADEVRTHAESAFTGDRLVSREGPIAAMGGAALILAGRPGAAESILDASITKARSRGSLQVPALLPRAYARLALGRIAEAEADARLALELAEHELLDGLRSLKLAALAEALIEQARLEEAASLLSAAELARDEREPRLFQQLGDAHARLLLLQGRAREALAPLDHQLRWQRDWGVRNPGWTSTRSLAALVHHALDDKDRARALAAEDLEAASAFGAPRALGIALRTMALVEAGPGIERLRESARVLEGSQARLELARTLVDLGAALRRTGARRVAREPLQRGLELALDCGGALVAGLARAELLATGARPRRPRVTGRDALTPSERRVAALARDGLSNREIAHALFLSPKTVEMHLSHTYDKLGIHSRARLAEALDSGESTGR